MGNRKVYCEAVEGVVYSDRCPLKLSKMISDNKTCERCLLLQLEKNERELKQALKTGPNRSKVKSARTKRTSGIKDTSDIKEISDIKDVKRKRERIKIKPEKKPKPIRNEGPIQTYSSQELSKLLGKSERRIQELACEGKISAHKVGQHWVFDKEKIDRLVSKKGKCIDVVPTVEGERVDVIPTIAIPLQEEGARPREQNKEDSTQPQKPETPVEKESF